MNNFEMNGGTQEVIKEPFDIFSDAARKKVESLFPEAGNKIDKIISPFIGDVLSIKNIPSQLHRFDPKRQEELLLTVGASTISDAIEIILKDIPKDILDFYKDKLDN
ncbi:MAG: hypothetical protein WC791_04025 [Candidatus Paceibacterota bacterium]|jgi:hypothetical protein